MCAVQSKAVNMDKALPDIRPTLGEVVISVNGSIGKMRSLAIIFLSAGEFELNIELNQFWAKFKH